jgi:hypothetical protein
MGKGSEGPSRRQRGVWKDGRRLAHGAKRLEPGCCLPLDRSTSTSICCLARPTQRTQRHGPRMAVGSPAQTPLKTPLKIAGLFGHLKYKPASPSANSVDVVATDIAAAAAGNGGQRQATSTSPSTADPKMATERSPFFASTLSPGAVKVEGDDDGHASEPSPLQCVAIGPAKRGAQTGQWPG